MIYSTSQLLKNKPYVFMPTSNPTEDKFVKNISPKFSGHLALAPVSILTPLTMIPALQYLPAAIADNYKHSNDFRNNFRSAGPDKIPEKDPYETLLEKERYKAVDDLILFSKKGLKEAFKERIERTFDPTDPNWCNKNGRTPLMSVSARGHCDLVNYLINKGANINAKDRYGKTAKDYASQYNQKEVVKILEGVHAEQGTSFCENIINDKADGVKDLLSTEGFDPNAIFSNSKKFINTFTQISPTQVATYLEQIRDFGFDINRKDKSGNNPLLLASANGQQELASTLLNNYANINIQDDEGKSPLALAIKHRHPELANFFINEGADVNLADRYGITPLMEAAAAENIPLMTKLLKNGAQANAINNMGMTALALNMGQNNIYRYEMAETLLSYGANPNVGEFDMLPLSRAIANGDPKMAALLLKKGGKANLYCSDNGKNFLHLIADEVENSNSVNLELANLFLSHGADVNRVNNLGLTPLMNAAANGMTELVPLFVDKGAYIHAEDNEGHTALGHAVYQNHVSTLEYLLSKGANPNQAGKEALLPLAEAVKKQYRDAATILLKYGANPNAADINGKRNPPLIAAITLNDSNLVSILIKGGANVNYVHDNNTPLVYSTQKNNLGLTKSLLNAGSDPNLSVSRNWFSESKKPLDFAIKNNNAELKSLLNISPEERIAQSEELLRNIDNNNLKAVESLLEKGANANYINAKKQFPLRQAILRENPNMVQLLLEHLALIRKTPYTSGELLNTAAILGRKDIIQILLNHGANVNSADQLGNTPLISASFKGFTEIVQMLLDHDANVNQANHEGVTPFMAASYSSHLRAAKLLRGYGAKVCVADKSGSRWKNGNTAKEYAAENSHKVMTQYIHKEQVKDGCA